MNAVWTILGELMGLFIDDGSLAVALLAWCALIAATIKLTPGIPAAASGAALLLGCVAILLVNVGRAARSRSRKH